MRPRSVALGSMMALAMGMGGLPGESACKPLRSPYTDDELRLKAIRDAKQLENEWRQNKRVKKKGKK